MAAAGFFVVVPNFFYDDPFVYDNNRPLAFWLEDHGTVRSRLFIDASIISLTHDRSIILFGALFQILIFGCMKLSGFHIVLHILIESP